MRNRPSPAFIAKCMAALPADGAPISARGVFLAIGEVSTPAYVRIVLRHLVIAGHIIATGPAGQRVYRRAIQSVECVPVGGQPAMPPETMIHERA